MDLTLLTESSDEDAGAVGGIMNIPSSDATSRHIRRTLDALSLASSESENDENMNRQSGYSFGAGGDDDVEEFQPGENLIEYSEVLVPATKTYSVAVEETGVLLNLLEDVPLPASTSARQSTPGARSGMKSEWGIWCSG